MFILENSQEGLNVALDGTYDIITRPAETKKLSNVTITRMIDMPTAKVVKVATLELGDLILWTGDEYDAIGQWTDADVQARIKALLIGQ